MDLLESLREYGLSEKEGQVYLALLQLGSTPVQRIAEKTGILRTTTYDTLRILKERGLVSFATNEKKTSYSAVQPSRLISLLREKEKRISEVIPELSKLALTSREMPSVKIFEGKEGIKALLEDVLAARRDFLCYASLDALLNLLRYYFPQFVERRVTLGIRARLILNKKPIGRTLTDYRILPLTLPTSTWIYGERVAILALTSQEPVGMIISDKDVANTQRAIFEIMWKAAKQK